MTNSMIALLGYSAWSITLLCAIAILRTTLTLKGVRSPNSFSATGEDVSPLSARLCRAHANCFENLPALSGIIVVAALSGNADIADPLAPWLLGARVGQSITHIASTSNRAVQLRFGLFLIQIVIQGSWIFQLLRQALNS
jgi:uncharacterized MAPEG superfamily protein